MTNTTYTDDKKTVTDPNGNVTEFEYNGLPGLVTKLKDPTGRYAISNYDGIGRLLEAEYNSARTQSFSYNGLDNLTSETHPETDIINYTYNTENNLWKKSWGDTSITYTYNRSNQITSIIAGDETITYEYDSSGRIKKISSNTTGWYRDNFVYNASGLITQERQSLPGLSGLKTVTYSYDANNNLKSITYPDGKIVDYTNNKLNMPNTATFNGKSLISQTSYGINKQPTYMYISGNGTEFNSSYDGSGFLSSASLKKSGNILYKATYGYDNAGNITSISDTAPSLNASFGYDNLNRLTSATYTPNGDSFSYVYDPYGNLETAKKNGGTIFSKSYTSKNQTSGYNYDSRGNLTKGSSYQYVWDNQNHLKEIRDSGSGALASHLYNERGLRFKAIRYASPTFFSEINIKQGISSVPDGGSFNFGSCNAGFYIDKTFTIENTGTDNLVLSGSPIITITPNDNQFSVQQQPTTPVSPGNSTTFIIRFAPQTEGSKTAYISIANNDSDENPYDITLYGSGIVEEPPPPPEPPERPDPPALPLLSVIPAREIKDRSDGLSDSDNSHLTIIYPNGGEQIKADSVQNISWMSDETVGDIKIEYSTDNGSTYHTIVERTQNIGIYQWKVPQRISSLCLIRISDADGYPTTPEIFTYEFKFKISRLRPSLQKDSDFTVCFELPDEKTISYKFANLSFVPDELNGKEDVVFNYNMAEVGNFETFLERWHDIRVRFDMNNYLGSAWMDGQLILDAIPLEISFDFGLEPAISISISNSASVTLWLEDLKVKMQDFNLRLQDEKLEDLALLNSMIKDNFDAYVAGEFPGEGGWAIFQRSLKKRGEIDRDISSDDRKKKIPAAKEPISAEERYIIDTSEVISGNQSFRIGGPGGDSVLIIKSFALPERVPFDVSDGNFAIVSKRLDGDKDRTEPNIRDRELERRKEEKRFEESDFVLEHKSGPYASEDGIGAISQIGDAYSKDQTVLQNQNKMGMLSVTDGTVYYVYSFDGKLLAEYKNENGVDSCLRDYIYMGNRLVAEYRPLEGKYYYYTSDQINSTRIITDDSGMVVYSEAYDPYGAIQKTWANTYDPALKFSGKEREHALDYFGARYYNYTGYRFISVDPLINNDGAISDPQLWNLYSYCGNNPVTFVDPDGRVTIKFDFKILPTSSQEIAELTGGKSRGGALACGVDLIYDYKKIKGLWSVHVAMNVKFHVYYPAKGDEVYNFKGLMGLPKTPEDSITHELGHIKLRSYLVQEIYVNASILEQIRVPFKFLAEAAVESNKFQNSIVSAWPNHVINWFYDFIKINLVKKPQELKE